MTHPRALRLFPLFSIACVLLTVHPAGAQDASAPVSSPVNAPAPLPDTGLTVQNVSPPAAEQIAAIDPLELYGNELVFDVIRKGTKIGEHRAVFTRQGDELTVRTDFSLGIDVLFFTAYKFKYDSTEIWRSGALAAVTANVDDNGKFAKVNGRIEDGLFKIDGPKGTDVGSSWVFPTNHWNRAQVSSRTLLNTITGRLNQVDVVKKGIESVATLQGPVQAERFEYTGQLRDTEVWYDASNRWVKMRFKARDGSWIEYKCRQCGLAAAATADAQPAGGN